MNGSDYCVPTSTKIKDKIIAQTIFLGASVIDFNANIGWGEQPSTLTVNLVNDNSYTGCLSSQHTGTISDNTYYSSNNDNLYVNQQGQQVNRRHPDAMLPGKVYYQTSFNSAYQVNQKWWQDKDPGFLGDNNNVMPDGSVVVQPGVYATSGYDITNCPVYFKMGDFSFGGVVQSWKKNKGQSGDIYTVVVHSMQALLNNCTVILDTYGGSISARLDSFGWSAPTNYVGNKLKYNTTNNDKGNIPNIFNVYGFLESFGPYSFAGSSYKTEEGFLCTEALIALMVLTGANNLNTRPGTQHDDVAAKTAFSPYSRIIAPSVAKSDMSGNWYTSNLWGVIAPTLPNQIWTGYNRCCFKLDLSELEYAIRGSNKRIKAESMSISQFIDYICDEHGLDWTTNLMNTADGWVIKVIAVSRRFAPTMNGIKSTVSKLICESSNNSGTGQGGGGVGSFSYGKEKNDTASRALIIGAPQQRLYQAKNTRLAYTQSNFIFNPSISAFVDYYQYGNIRVNVLGNNVSCTDNTGQRVFAAGGSTFGYGKIKFPAFYSNRNPSLDDRLPSLKTDEQVHADIEGGGFAARDTIFEDYELDSASITRVRRGNYKKTEFITHGTDVRYAIDPCPNGPLQVLNQLTFQTIPEGGSITNRRFYPLYRDVVCPFFGHLLEDRYDVNAQNANTDFKRIRPVWYDFWTGQIVLLFHKDELPQTRIGLKGRYTNYTFGRQSNVSLLSPSITLSSTPDPAAATAAATAAPQASPTPAYLDTPNYTAEWFLVTENEIRAAMAGSDNFISYTLGKRFKTDLYIMMTSAYTERSRIKYINEGKTPAQALKLAIEENNWNWQFYRDSHAGVEGNLGPQTSLSSQSIHQLSSEARKDFDLISNFIKRVGDEYYGKQYMVTAPYLQSRTEQDAYSFKLQTEQGNVSVFKGGGGIRYNYEPCSADNGAWEEPGNSIDDCMLAGDRYVSALSNDKGQIKPILGYNATYAFDYIRRELARITAAKANSLDESSINPYFSYSAWDSINALRRSDANDDSKYYYENLNIADLSSAIEDFVIVTGMATTSITNTRSLLPPPFTRPTDIIGKDAFGISHNAKKRKLYKSCNVDSKFHFMDPEKMLEPKMIVTTERLSLNSSSELYQSDPANTVSATIGMEELAIYTRRGGRDPEEYNKFFEFFSPYQQYNQALYDCAHITDNSTGRNIKIAPKAAHPSFVGIPIKSNTYCYGPWTNYPALVNNKDLFSTGVNYSITNIDTSYNACSQVNTTYPNTTQKNYIVDNWITNTKFEVVPDFCPWNFGSMTELDTVATNYVSGLVNYQTSIEIGSLEMVGTPQFTLGGSFSYETIVDNLSWQDVTSTYIFKDVKPGSLYPITPPVLTLDVDNYNRIIDPLYVTNTINYVVPDIAIKDVNDKRIRYDYYSQAPILTNIMTSMGQNGITTTYSFRTYTRKLSLFNRQEIDRSKKLAQENLKRRKEISKLSQRIDNNQFADKAKIKSEQFSQAATVPTLSLGTSPVTTIVCSTKKSLGKFNNTGSEVSTSSYSAPFILPGSTEYNVSYSGAGADDICPGGHLADGFENQTADNQARYMFFEQRSATSAKIYPDSEISDALKETWGRASIMSLDGLFSPISFYPTIGKDTFSMSKYDEDNCPICGGYKKIKRPWKRYKTTTNTTSSTGYVDYCCDSCARPYQKVNASTYFGTSTTSKDGEYFPPYIVSSGNTLDELKKFNTFIYQRSIKDNTDRLGMSVTIPINMSTLQPIVMPLHEFSNANAQNYSGEHPDGVHNQLSLGGKNRNFIDKGRNSISVIGRGSVFNDIIGNLNSAESIGLSGSLSSDISYVRNYDYDYYDSRFKRRMAATDYSTFIDKDFEQNMRFVGFRGPMMMHGWGYDTEGYPVPNAADEPIEIDPYGRPKRFKTIREVETTSVKYSSLGVGEAFCIDQANSYDTETVKLHSLKIQNSTYYNRKSNANITDDTMVYKINYKDDYTDGGGFLPATYNGNIISKTQKWTNGKWTPKIKLKQFYLNWAERQDLWPVGPIDLRWDPERKVWTANTQRIYKMVYVTLEEDMTKDPDLDESFPARGFLDDMEYSTQALDANKRRLVYVKDRSGYSAPRGARLYCRYDSDTGFYEPVSKQQFIVYGSMAAGGNTATITMSYVQGKIRGGSHPTMSIVFNNPLGLNTNSGVGMFSYINGEWTLISSR